LSYSEAAKEDAMTAAPQTKEIISFGPFRLIASERQLTKDGAPVPLGARALDILIALVSQPNKAISKRDLLARIWPDVTVEEGSLRFHIAGLRKALGDGKDGARYISTLAGRGYCFLAPISRSGDQGNKLAADATGFSHANLPGRLMRMVGRDHDVLRVSTQLTASRFVTIVGPGGVGKTTVAITVGHHLIEAFAGVALFVDLGMLSDAKLVATVIASMLGLTVHSEDATPNLIAYLRDKRVLLILDTCEHLIEAVANLAANIVAAAPNVHILATSREALQVEGEHVYKLDALACPPDDRKFTAAALQMFPATQLFLERAVASGARLDLNDADAAIVVGICRRLDGVALAIELAARRVESHGLQQTAALLDQRLTLLWMGQRSAPPRQKTLQATLDWSYGLLSELERTVLRRLAVFVGHFTLDAALAVVTGTDIDQTQVFGAIDSLVAKSMIATRPRGAMMRYHLLDTTRAYVLEIDVDAAERVSLAVRHANYYRQWLKQHDAETPIISKGVAQAPDFAAINNVRAALEWCFDANGDAQVGIALAADAAPVFSAMSLLTECHRWAAQAIGALNDATRGGFDEMHLQAALGLSLLLMRGSTEAARVALNRGLTIAEERGDMLRQLQLLAPLNGYHFTIGDFKTTLIFGKRASAISKTIADPAAIALAHCISGMSLAHTGDLAGARVELEAARQRAPSAQPPKAIYLGFDGHVWAGIFLARTLWLQGHPDQAAERAHQAIKEAASIDHPVTLSIVLIRAIYLFLWIGDLATAEELLDWFIAHAKSHSLGPYLAVGVGYKGLLAVRRGDARGGVESLQGALAELHSARYELLTAIFNISLVQGLAAMGRFAEAIALIDEAIRLVEANGELSHMAELLRVKGNVLLSMGGPSDEAEMCFVQSLELSRRQGARAWELRTATDLAAFWASHGRSADARGLLLPVFEQFTEGPDTADLQAAERLLTTLS
jgi:predicted ATPase/DNA-binding winged helix-turn-helix (wHTH) protein